MILPSLKVFAWILVSFAIPIVRGASLSTVVGQRPGDSYDKRLRTSIFNTVECEILNRDRLKSQAVAKMSISDFL